MNWILLSKEPPPPCTEVICFKKEWIDEDFNPEGIRVGFMDDDNNWTSADWYNDQDTYWNDEKSIPTHWMQKPEPPTTVSQH
jgi:hypothetical protein